MQTLQVTDATAEDVPSLSNIVARSFHQTNDFHRQVMPDTPLMKKWWSQIFLHEIHEPSCHALTVIDPDAQDPAKRALGILLLRRMTSDDRGAGVYDQFPLTEDHDKARYACMLQPMLAARGEIMGDSTHYLLELFGVDADTQGTGLGKKLLQRACDISDREGIDIFVEANMFAKAFYEKAGFVCKDEVVLPGPEAYGEAMLVYASHGRT